MNDELQKARSERAATRSKVSKLIIWSNIAALFAVVMARVAVWLQAAGFSTVVLFPLLIGGVLGAAVGLVAAQIGETRRVLVLSGVILAAGLCAAAEHGFFYLDYRRGFEEKLQNNPAAQLAATANPEFIAPHSFSQFMAMSASEKWPLWIADALAMIGSTAAAAWFVFASVLRVPAG